MALGNSILNRYHVQVEKYDGFLSDQRTYFDGLDFFKPYVERINAIEALLEDCLEYLEDLDEEDDEEEDDEFDYDALEDELKDNYAERLVELFNMDIPDLSPKSTPKKFEAIFDDINSFIELNYEDVKDEGMKLYHVFIGAA